MCLFLRQYQTVLNNLEIYSEVRECDSSSILSLDCFGLFRSFVFHTNNVIICSRFVQSVIGILEEIDLNL